MKILNCSEIELVMESQEIVNLRTSVISGTADDERAYLYQAHGINESIDTANDSYRRARSISISKTGKTTYKELIIEIRTKYLNILKSVYWNKFEKGMMSGDAVIVL